MKNNFLQFINQLYDHQQIKNILRNLQERLKLNLNILLFCCWFARQGCRNLSKKELQNIINSIAPWHNQIIIALQKMYLDSKKVNNQAWQEHISSKITDTIFSAQQMEQVTIAETIARAPADRTSNQKIADACKSISAYCKELQIGLEQQDIEYIQQLLIYIFPDSNYDSLVSYWENFAGNKKQKAFSYLQPQLDEL